MTGEPIERAYFERGFIAAAAWAMTKREDVKLSDDVIDHAWAHRDEGMDPEDMLPPLRPSAPGTPPTSEREGDYEPQATVEHIRSIADQLAKEGREDEALEIVRAADMLLAASPNQETQHG